MKKLFSIILTLTLATACAFSLTACGDVSTEEKDEEAEKIEQIIEQITFGETYCFSLEGSEGITDYYMDADGNYLSDKISITPICDVFTEETTYYLVSEDISGGSDDQVYYNAIYNTDGERLCSFSADNYGKYSIGGYILKSNFLTDDSDNEYYDENYYLWDLEDEEIAQPGVCNIEKIDDTHAIAVSSNERALGILGDDGEYTYEFSEEENYYAPECANGYFMVATVSPDTETEDSYVEDALEVDDGETIDDIDATDENTEDSEEDDESETNLDSVEDENDSADYNSDTESELDDEEAEDDVNYEEEVDDDSDDEDNGGEDDVIQDEGDEDVDDDVENNFVTYKIFDCEMNLLASNDEDFDISIQNVIGKYYTKTDDDTTSVVDVESGKILASGSAISYYDGECMIDYEGEMAYLCNGSGEKLSSGYSYVEPGNDSCLADDEKASYFIAWNSDKVAILGTDGQETTSIDVDDVTDVSGYGDYISVTTAGLDEVATLYKSDLSVVVPGEKYFSIMPVDGTWGGEIPEGIFVATYYDENYDALIALLNEDGELIVDGLKAIDVVDDEHFACIIGDQIGFIDLDGEWTKQTTIELPVVIEENEFDEETEDAEVEEQSEETEETSEEIYDEVQGENTEETQKDSSEASQGENTEETTNESAETSQGENYM